MTINPYRAPADPIVVSQDIIDQGPHSVTFDTGPAELFEVNWSQLSGGSRLRWAATVCIAIGGMLSAMWRWQPETPMLAFFLVVLIVVPVLSWCGGIAMELAARGALRYLLKGMVSQGAYAGAFGPERLVLLPEGLYNESRMGKAMYYWEVLSKIAETPTHVIVFLANQTGYAIPRSSFISQDAARAFMDALKTYAPQANYVEHRSSRLRRAS